MKFYYSHNFKTLTLFCILLSISSFLNAKVYYSKSSNNVANRNSWTTNRAGTGIRPSNFNQSDTFVVQPGHNMFTLSPWKLGGIRSGIVIETNGKITARDSINVTTSTLFNIKSGGTYIHANKSYAPRAIFNGIEVFEANSNVDIRNWRDNTVPITVSNFGNLKISYQNTAIWNQKNNISLINGNFLLDNNSTAAFQFANNNDYTLTINKNFIVKSGVFTFSGPYSKLYNLNLKGGFIQLGGIIRNPSAGLLPSIWTVNYSGDSSFYYKQAGTFTNSQINYTVQAAAKFYIGTSFTVTTSRTFINYGTLFCDTLNISGNGTLRVNANSTIYIGSLDGLAPVGQYYGNIRTTNRIFSSSATYVYYGKSEQNSGEGIPYTISNLKILLSNSTDNLNLEKDIRVADNLYLTSGEVFTNGFLFTLGTSTVDLGTLNISNGFVIGTFARYFAPTTNSGNTGLMPIGVDNIYRPAKIEFTTAPTTGGLIQAEFIDSDPGDYGLGIADGSLNITNSSEVGYWKLEVLSGNFVSGIFTNTLYPNNFSDITDPSTLHIITRNTGGSWSLDGNHVTSTGTITNPVVTRTGMTKIGELGITINSTDITLPVSWNTFNVAPQENDAQLLWATNIEVNNNHYEIERSIDAINFEKVGEVDAKGNTAELSTYEFFDKDALTINAAHLYYRIKQVDNDNAYSYSKIETISLNQNEQQNNTENPIITVFPNPTTDYIQINSNQEVQSVTIYNMNGQPIYQNLDHQVSNRIDLSNYTPAIYIVSIGLSNNQTISKTIIKN